MEHMPKPSALFGVQVTCVKNAVCNMLYQLIGQVNIFSVPTIIMYSRTGFQFLSEL